MSCSPKIDWFLYINSFFSLCTVTKCQISGNIVIGFINIYIYLSSIVPASHQYLAVDTIEMEMFRFRVLITVLQKWFRFGILNTFLKLNKLFFCKTRSLEVLPTVHATKT